jgi:hypothetical protein
MLKESEKKGFVDNFPFVHIFRTFRIAIQPTKITLAFIAILVLAFAGTLMDLTATVVSTPDSAYYSNELHAYIQGDYEYKTYLADYEQTAENTGVFSTLWHFCSEKGHNILVSVLTLDFVRAKENVNQYILAIQWALKHHPVYYVLFGLIKLAVFAVIGGAICRITAMQFAKKENPGLTASLKYSISRFKDYFTAPLIPIAIILAVMLCLFLFSLLGNIPWVGELLIALSLPLLLLAGAVIVVMLIGAFAGFNLMYPAVSYDGSDGFDAISRAFSYVFSRPWRMLFYSLTAAIYGGICYLFVRFFAFLLMESTRIGLRSGIWTENSADVNKLNAIYPEHNFMNLLNTVNIDPANATQAISAFVINIFLLVIVAALAAFIISFFFSANTIIYSLLREKVDNTPVNDVYSEKADSAVENSEETPEQA